MFNNYHSKLYENTIKGDETAAANWQLRILLFLLIIDTYISQRYEEISRSFLCEDTIAIEYDKCTRSKSILKKRLTMVNLPRLRRDEEGST